MRVGIRHILGAPRFRIPIPDSFLFDTTAGRPFSSVSWGASHEASGLYCPNSKLKGCRVPGQLISLCRKNAYEALSASIWTIFFNCSLQTINVFKTYRTKFGTRRFATRRVRCELTGTKCRMPFASPPRLCRKENEQSAGQS